MNVGVESARIRTADKNKDNGGSRSAGPPPFHLQEENGMQADHRWLQDPEVFGVNREAAHSDHHWYGTEEERMNMIADVLEYELERHGLKTARNTPVSAFS